MGTSSVFKGYMIPVILWRKRKVGPSMCSFWKLQTNRRSRMGSCRGAPGKVEFRQHSGCSFCRVVSEHFASLRFVHWSLNRGNPLQLLFHERVKYQENRGSLSQIDVLHSRFCAQTTLSFWRSALFSQWRAGFFNGWIHSLGLLSVYSIC